ncbi:MAG: glycosyltransferase, partial [Elusimicrobia bacterium]|nr:glycosyltransferase [Elusimicrobiota bacterium]
NLKLENHVFLLGEQMNVRPWFCGMDIFVLPSLWEGTPNVLLEAMALGLPCIASSVDGIQEILEGGKTGLLSPPGDPQKLSENIKALMNNLPFRNRLGIQAQEVIAQRFTVGEMLENYQEAYHRMVP